MEDFFKTLKSNELIVRKRLNLFLEKLIRFFKYDIRHDIFKGITYAECATDTPLEEKIKNYYDAFIYLIENCRNPLTVERLKKFFYLLYGREMENDLMIRLTSKLFYMQDTPLIEKITEYHLYMYHQLSQFSEEDRMIISLMFINYLLTKNGIPCIRILVGDLKKYVGCREKYFAGSKEEMYEFIWNILKNSKFQAKSYYKNLKKLTILDIYKTILNDKELLQEKYKVSSIYLFGSFAKGEDRFDSDVDLAVIFSPELLSETKLVYLNAISERYYKLFHRYIDVHEISNYISDNVIREFSKIKRII